MSPNIEISEINDGQTDADIVNDQWLDLGEDTEHDKDRRLTNY